MLSVSEAVSTRHDQYRNDHVQGIAHKCLGEDPSDTITTQIFFIITVHCGNMSIKCIPP